ncbi:TIGR01906 family membrane protein [Lactobacillus sp. S2-2]|uniref:TIGR01906 family membrane protein n=1 Tax=Lactobacillus sp. S2-2 TaxID=2692917 RepID=UPI001F896DB1|nr:TIGR01906 family membrane protein [Lactobacillus sp. S2-2]
MILGKYKILITNLIIYLFIISFSFYLTLNSNFLYLLMIKCHELNISYYGMYKSVIEYLNSPAEYYLKVHNVFISNNVVTHFKEVKHLIEFNNVILLFSGFLSVYVFFFNRYLFINPLKIIYKYKLSLIILIVFIVADFKEIFYCLHELLFNNNYWMINPDKDPIINVFPEYYFQYFFILMIFYMIITILFIFKRKRS